MKEKIDRIEEIISEINEIYKKLCQGDTNEGFRKFALQVANINGIFTELIDNIPKLWQYDIDIPSDVIIQQLNNMLESYEKKDVMMLTDTLRYEITDTLQFYKEVLQECIKENIVL